MTHRDHLVWRLFVCLSVCHTVMSSHFHIKVILICCCVSKATHAFFECSHYFLLYLLEDQSLKGQANISHLLRILSLYFANGIRKEYCFSFVCVNIVDTVIFSHLLFEISIKKFLKTNFTKVKQLICSYLE